MGFLPYCGGGNTTEWMHYIYTDKRHREKTRWELHKDTMCCFKQILEAAPNKTVLYCHLNPISKPLQVTLTRHVASRTNSSMTFFNGPLYMDVPVMANQQELTNISSVQTLDLVWKTCQKWWMIGIERERARKIHADHITWRKWRLTWGIKWIYMDQDKNYLVTMTYVSQRYQTTLALLLRVQGREVLLWVYNSHEQTHLVFLSHSPDDGKITE